MPEVSCPRGRGSGEARTIAHEGADLGIVLSALARLRTPAVTSAPAVSRGTMSAGADSQLAGWSPQHGWTRSRRRGVAVGGRPTARRRSTHRVACPRLDEAQAELRACARAGARDPPASDMDGPRMRMFTWSDTRRSDVGGRCPSGGQAWVDQAGRGVDRSSMGALRATRVTRGLRAIGTGGRTRMRSGPLRAEKVRGLRAAATMECDVAGAEARGATSFRPAREVPAGGDERRKP